VSVKLTLQTLSDWIMDSAKAAKGAADLTVESGLLRESLQDLSEVGGLVGAVFKLGSRAIPDPTPEQRIAARLHRALVIALDRELKDNPDLVSRGTWRNYIGTQLPAVATSKLSIQFTWLSIFGSRGRTPGRSWPIIGELADLGRIWIADMMVLDGHYTAEKVQPTADDVRGRIHEALTREIDSLLTEPVILQAINESQPRVTRDALDLLAQELTTLSRYRLFGEIPQDTVYISPTVKVTDLRNDRREIDWSNLEARGGGEEILFQAIRDGHPRLFVLEGEMGVGKSCLMRLLSSRLADQYRSDRRQAPIYIRWRDVYENPDLGKAIADQLFAAFGLPLHDLPDQSDIIYLVDGFDEMSSHQEGYVTQCFDRLAKFIQRRCSVVVAMRSTVITPSLRLAWENREAVAVQVQHFNSSDVDIWAKKWCAQTGAETVTGERLRSLGGDAVATNPLLLYMLAKYVHPLARSQDGSLTRTAIFRVFVDETIRGKLRTSQEQFPFTVPEREYRTLLQEIAYLSSWPKHAPKCPARLVRERIKGSFLSDLNFLDIRTAFVLHFFEPGDASGNEFEFQPEGFRQYLLAEWCVRAQLDALRDERRPSHPFARSRDQALQALAQFPLKEEERFLLNEIYEDLGRESLCDENAAQERLRIFGVSDDFLHPASAMVKRLYERARDDAEDPPSWNWEDEKVGIPEGQEIAPGLNDLRLLCNYWDQCMLAALGLYRGVHSCGGIPTVRQIEARAICSFLRTLQVVRGFSWSVPIELANLALPNSDFSNIGFFLANLAQVNLSGSNLTRVVLKLANLPAANLADAKLSMADMERARLRGANLTRANLRRAVLNRADLRDADLTGADLSNADLTDADLTDANLTNADLMGATVSEEQLRVSRGQIRRMPSG
jgi:pentapeptide repeat protein/NACHT domain-containing protein